MWSSTAAVNSRRQIGHNLSTIKDAQVLQQATTKDYLLFFVLKIFFWVTMSTRRKHTSSRILETDNASHCCVAQCCDAFSNRRRLLFVGNRWSWCFRHEHRIVDRAWRRRRNTTMCKWNAFRLALLRNRRCLKYGSIVWISLLFERFKCNFMPFRREHSSYDGPIYCWHDNQSTTP